MKLKEEESIKRHTKILNKGGDKRRGCENRQEMLTQF